MYLQTQVSQRSRRLIFEHLVEIQSPAVAAFSIKDPHAFCVYKGKSDLQKKQECFAFLSSRVSDGLEEFMNPKEFKKKAKGREIYAHQIPRGAKAQFQEAEVKDWLNWHDHEACEFFAPPGTDMKGKNVLKLRYVRVDKNDTSRGNRTHAEFPIEARCRLVVDGFNDLEALDGISRKDAATLSLEGQSWIYQVCASKGWIIRQGDVSSASLSGQFFIR